MEQVKGLPWTPRKDYYHFRKGGHVAALEYHIDNHVFARLDIANFFPSVTKSKIIRSLKRIGFSYSDSAQFAGESTIWIDDRLVLPYGFVQSPYLATLALDQSALGKALKAHRSKEVRLAVYMDDILISHDESYEDVTETMITLQEAGAEAGFNFNLAKTEGPSHSISVFNIRLRNGHMEILEERFEEFHEHILMWGNCASTLATISYVGTVNSPQSKILEASLS